MSYMSMSMSMSNQVAYAAQTTVHVVYEVKGSALIPKVKCCSEGEAADAAVAGSSASGRLYRVIPTPSKEVSDLPRYKGGL